MSHTNTKWLASNASGEQLVVVHYLRHENANKTTNGFDN